MDKENDSPAATGPKALHLLVFEGKCLPGFDEAAMREALARHLRRAPTELFTGKPVVLTDAMDAAETEVAKRALEAIGACVTVEVVEAAPPMEPLGFLDLVVPAPVAQASSAAENLPVVDSGWKAPNLAVAPSSDEALPDFLLDIAAGLKTLNQESTDAGPTAPEAAPISAPTVTGFSSLPRPPIDRSALFGNAPVPVGEPSPVFAPIPRSPLPPARDVRDVRDSRDSRDSRDIGLPVTPATSMAAPLAAPAVAANESALLVICPNCSESQTMRVLCRACGANLKSALAAKHEEREKKRAVAGGSAAAGKLVPSGDDGMRFLGFLVPEHVAERFTLANGLRTLFVFLAMLVVLSFVWSKLRPDPVLTTPKLVPQVSVSSSPVAASAGSAADDSNPVAEVPPPPEEDVVSRLQGGAAAATFRQSYWPTKGQKVFVVSGNSAWAWRAEMPSVTRALAEALGECESLRLPDEPACKVVSVNNFWQE